MPTSPYWNPKTETLPRGELDRLQLQKLRYQCEWANAQSPWYRERFRANGFNPVDLKTLDDLRRVPLLTREEWMDSQAEHPPFGRLPTIKPEQAVRVHTTSGTSGRMPLRALDTRKDWSWV